MKYAWLSLTLLFLNSCVRLHYQHGEDAGQHLYVVDALHGHRAIHVALLYGVVRPYQLPAFFRKFCHILL